MTLLLLNDSAFKGENPAGTAKDLVSMARANSVPATSNCRSPFRRKTIRARERLAVSLFGRRRGYKIPV